jgi:hypothetical protein
VTRSEEPLASSMDNGGLVVSLGWRNRATRISHSSNLVRSVHSVGGRRLWRDPAPHVDVTVPRLWQEAIEWRCLAMLEIGLLNEQRVTRGPDAGGWHIIFSFGRASGLPHPACWGSAGEAAPCLLFPARFQRASGTHEFETRASHPAPNARRRPFVGRPAHDVDLARLSIVPR